MASGSATAYAGAALPAGVRSRMVPGVNGLDMHVLEAGEAGRPAVVLLHGFPELAWSWRLVMPALAAAGFHVVAPDQRGYGRTTGWDGAYDGDLGSFRYLNLVRDVLALVRRLGLEQVAGVVGHDFGSPIAGWCALVRPDVFPAVAMMSAPFDRPPAFPLGAGGGAPGGNIAAALAALPRPRRHYQHYYATRAAEPDMLRCPEGVHAFLRAYFHMKSADWAGNRPAPLAAWTAAELARLPTYYVMDLDRTMPESVRAAMPSAGAIAACRWLTDDDLAVYAGEFARTGFQGGLQWYRCRFVPAFEDELRLFSGRTIDVPSCFIAGSSDWGIHQVPGALERMQGGACTRMLGCHLLDGAGHWVQQEQAAEVSRLLVAFLDAVPAA